jgi:hypothetical protein
MDSDKHVKMTHEIQDGKSKSESQFSDEPDFDARWDATSADVAKIMDIPGAVVDLPFEFP